MHKEINKARAKWRESTLKCHSVSNRSKKVPALFKKSTGSFIRLRKQSEGKDSPHRTIYEAVIRTLRE
jgi:hypothetical protein